MIDRWIVVAVGEGDGGASMLTPVATCLSPEDAQHFLTTCLGDDLGAFVLPVESSEWVHPDFAELASVPGKGS